MSETVRESILYVYKNPSEGGIMYGLKGHTVRQRQKDLYEEIRQSRLARRSSETKTRIAGLLPLHTVFTRSRTERS